jgi:H+/Cl- antiporter ClcA
VQINKNIIAHYKRWIVLSTLSGVFAGIAATVFLFGLQWVTQWRNHHPTIIWGLPLIGLVIGWVYFYYGKNSAAGNNLILDEIHDPQKVLPLRMAPLVLFGTLLTHLFGGSAGREGTAVQMGATLSDQLSRFFHLNAQGRRIILAAGAGAGFGAAIGAPWAGMIFGMEVIRIGRIQLFAIVECGIASFVGYGVTLLLGAPHTDYPSISIPFLDMNILFSVACAGVAFGFAAKAFTSTAHLVEEVFTKYIKYPPLRPFVGGFVLMALFTIPGSYIYAGLGLDHIQNAMITQRGFNEPALKIIFTAFTVGTGFKGGEFIPLVFIGVTLGSALGFILPAPFPLLAALGFAAVFGAAANAPIACALMAMEIFGYQIGPYAFLACFMAYYFSGHHGIYRSQKFEMTKVQRLKSYFNEFREKLFPSKDLAKRKSPTKK